MIRKTGIALITSDDIYFYGFQFGPPYTEENCNAEALQWLFERIMNDPIFLRAFTKHSLSMEILAQQQDEGESNG